MIWTENPFWIHLFLLLLLPYLHASARFYYLSSSPLSCLVAYFCRLWVALLPLTLAFECLWMPLNAFCMMLFDCPSFSSRPWLLLPFFVLACVWLLKCPMMMQIWGLVGLVALDMFYLLPNDEHYEVLELVASICQWQNLFEGLRVTGLGLLRAQVWISLGFILGCSGRYWYMLVIWF